jgi:predicted dehydrogenase
MKVLIVGFGSIARKHYKALVQIDPGVNVFALRSGLNSESLDNIQSLYHSEELNLFAPFDFAIISNPTHKHEVTIDTLLSLKCPLFIEKPLFHSLESFRILNEISLSKTLTYVACNLRFLDSVQYVKYELLPKVEINEVNIYCGSFLPEWRQGVDYKSTYSAHSEQGGGVHLDLIHELDYTYWFFGHPMSVTSHKRSKSTIEIDSVDYANYFLEYDRFAVNIILNYFRKDKKRSIELVCSDDTYYIDLCSNSVSSTKGIIFKSKQEISDTYLNQMQYFTDRLYDPLKRNIAFMNDALEAFEVLKICLSDDIRR